MRSTARRFIGDPGARAHESVGLDDSMGGSCGGRGVGRMRGVTVEMASYADLEKKAARALARD